MSSAIYTRGILKLYGLQLEGLSMSFLRVSYMAQLSAATSSLVSFYRDDWLKLAQNNFVCMDGLPLFFIAMLNPARQGGKSTLFTVCTVLNYPAHQLFDIWTSDNHKNRQTQGKNSCADRA